MGPSEGPTILHPLFGTKHQLLKPTLISFLFEPYWYYFFWWNHIAFCEVIFWSINLCAHYLCFWWLSCSLNQQQETSLCLGRCSALSHSCIEKDLKGCVSFLNLNLCQQASLLQGSNQVGLQWSSQYVELSPHHKKSKWNLFQSFHQNQQKKKRQSW